MPENQKQQKIKNLKIIQDRLLFTSSCYRDPFQFFIGYNLLIQIAGSEASSFAVSSEDVNKERLVKKLELVGPETDGYQNLPVPELTGPRPYRS